MKTGSWRKFAISIYGAPKEGKVYGTQDIDVTDMMAYIKKKKENGERLTVTYFMIAAVARALYEDAPDINCFVRRGGVIYRNDADVFISVAQHDKKQMTGIIVKKAQEMSVSEIGEYILERLETKRSGKESGAFAAKEVIAKIPWPFRKPVIQFIKWWSFEMGFYFPFLKIPSDPFGSIMVTNIGGYGLTTGMVALFPLGKLPGVITIGKIQDKAVVIDGEIKIRTILPMTGTFDHRITDGSQIGRLSKGIADRLQKPAELNKPNRDKGE